STNEREAAAEGVSNDSEEIARVLTSLDAANVLAGETNVPTGSGSIPTAGPSATIVSTGSEVGPTASPTVRRRKGKEIMVESDTPKKKKLQEQIDAQMARELEEQQEREYLKMNEQIARDAEVARIHAEEEIQEHNIDFHQIVDFIEASHIRKVFTTLRVNNPSFSGRIVPLFASMLVTQGEGSAIPIEPHHTPSPQEQHSPHHDPSSPLYPTTTTEPIPQTSTETPTLRQYSRRATRIAQSKALSPAADEPASLLGDDRQGKAFPTVFSLDTGQDRENITKTSALPYESSPRVTSLDADEGNQDLEISGLKARVMFLDDKDKGSAEPTQEDAPIKGGIIKTGEEVGADKSTKLGSNDTDEMVNVLNSIEAANILTSEVAAISVSPVAGVSTVGVPTISRLFPTASVIFTTASVIDAQVAREMEEEFARENKRSNEVIAKHLQDYEQAEAELTIGEKIELINELVKYQDHHAKILKYQAQQSKPLSKKEQRETSEDVSEKDLKGMMRLVPLEEVYVEALQVKHPIIDWEIHSEGKREYWKIIRLGGRTAVYQFFVDMLKQFDREDLHQLWTLVTETLSIK
nr:hypothetical protein [Tanacetum cinerariifolium]